VHYSTNRLHKPNWNADNVPILKPYKEANPMVWGAWGALVGGIGGTIATVVDAMPDSQAIGGLVAGGFFWLFVTAQIRNWLASRR
jgi:hypothetical protein